MMAKVIDGKLIAEQIRAEVALAVSQRVAAGKIPTGIGNRSGGRKSCQPILC